MGAAVAGLVFEEWRSPHQQPHPFAVLAQHFGRHLALADLHRATLAAALLPDCLLPPDDVSLKEFIAALNPLRHPAQESRFAQQEQESTWVCRIRSCAPRSLRRTTDHPALLIDDKQLHRLRPCAGSSYARCELVDLGEGVGVGWGLI